MKLGQRVEPLLEELSDDTEDERRDFLDAERNPFESEHGPVMGTDGDDNPQYARPKEQMSWRGRSVEVKLENGKTSRVEVIEPGAIPEAVRVEPAENPAGEIVDGGHGFIVNNPRSREWKTATRTHCAHCGERMPTPDVSRYPCELDPDATDTELSRVGHDMPWSHGQLYPGCQCSRCDLRWQVANGAERNRGQPKKYCTPDCRKQADAKRNAWKRAVARAEKHGQEPPPEPEDQGLKFVLHLGPRSSSEGSGQRYTSAKGIPWGAPRA